MQLILLAKLERRLRRLLEQLWQTRGKSRLPCDNRKKLSPWSRLKPSTFQLLLMRCPLGLLLLIIRALVLISLLSSTGLILVIVGLWWPSLSAAACALIWGDRRTLNLRVVILVLQVILPWRGLLWVLLPSTVLAISALLELLLSFLVPLVEVLLRLLDYLILLLSVCPHLIFHLLLACGLISRLVLLTSLLCLIMILLLMLVQISRVALFERLKQILQL